MPRIRTIKPEFPQSESMGRISRDARLTFILLWTLADDSGRLRGNSRMLASLLYPYDDDAKELISGWLSELERVGCIFRYVHNNDSYIEVCNWLLHQKIDKPSASKIPPFANVREDSSNVREDSSLDQGSRIKDQGKDQGEDQGTERKNARRRAPACEDSPDFTEFWQAYPRKENKGAARQAFAKAILKAPPEVILQAVKVFATSPKGRGDYCPHASTWLNQERWTDDPKQWERTETNGTPQKRIVINIPKIGSTT